MTVSSQEATLQTLLEQALTKKSIRAIQAAMELGRIYNDEEPAAEVAALSDQDEALINAFLDRRSGESFEEGENEDDDGCVDS